MLQILLLLHFGGCAGEGEVGGGGGCGEGGRGAGKEGFTDQWASCSLDSNESRVSADDDAVSSGRPFQPARLLGVERTTSAGRRCGVSGVTVGRLEGLAVRVMAVSSRAA